MFLSVTVVTVLAQSDQNSKAVASTGLANTVPNSWALILPIGRDYVPVVTILNGPHTAFGAFPPHGVVRLDLDQT